LSCSEEFFSPVFAALPDTGQTKCYANSEVTCPSTGQDYYGQDANYTINPPSYTKIDANGNALPDSATSWSMVKDNITGLIWENKTTDASIHDQGDTYKWADAQNVFIAQLNTSKFGGYSDWHLPTREELRSIVDYSRCTPAIDTRYFQNTQPSWYYWSSTVNASDANNAWNVEFGCGGSPDTIKSEYWYVRAVRGGNSGLSSFVNNNDGTITDKSTELMWQQDTGNNSQPMTWKAGLSYCENLSLAGYTDWRLPNIRELASLVDLSRYNPSIDTGYFSNTLLNYYWSSTTYEYLSYTNFAWGISFDKGYLSTPGGGKSGSVYVRCVRGGQFQTNNRIISLSGDLAFGNVTASTNKQLTLTIYNTGTSTLSVNSIAYPTGFSGNWSGGTIAAGGSQPVTVTFSPSAVQSYNGTVTVNSDKTSGTNTIAISGNGIADPCQCTDTNGSTQQGIDLVKANPSDYQLFNQTQLNQKIADAVTTEQLKWDANGDGKIGLEDIIRMLQVIAGLRDRKTQLN